MSQLPYKDLRELCQLVQKLNMTVHAEMMRWINVSP